MRSIRFTLLVYFLSLVALVLAAVSFYVYEENRSTLAAKEKSMRELLETRFREDQQAINEKLDDELLRQAHTLASLAQAQWKPPPLNLPYSLTALSVAPVPLAYGPPLAYAPLFVCLGEDVPSPLSGRVHRLRFQIEFAEHVVQSQPQGQPTAYFQLSSDSGQTLQRSTSLAGRMLPQRPGIERIDLFDSFSEEFELQPGTRVRCVTLRAPVTRQLVIWPPRFRGPAGGPGSGSASSAPPPRRDTPPPPRESKAPALIIQCARGTEQRDQAIAGLQAKLDEDLNGVHKESETALSLLRMRLILLALSAMMATVLGGIWLVHRVLRPVQRISQAVSQVSEKDFLLRLNAREVPAELSPIVERLEYALQSLGGAFAREKQAAADISHELRTPISALLATTQVCLRKARTPEEYRAALQNCRDIGQQLSTLVERLLTLARLDAGADKLRPEAVDVPELAEQCVEMVRALAESRDLSLHLERNGPVVLETDPDKLREVLINLLHNAIQYNRPKGRIDVAVEKNNGHVELLVRDTGIGISPEAQAHLFERFYRADPSRQSDTVQAGLGLAIVKGYLDLMGGAIDVESTAGVGSTFRVSLPA